jgi:phage-related minor tail protein
VLGIAQNYTITQQPTYGQNPKYTPTTYTVQQTKTAADHYNDLQKNLSNSFNQASQIYAQRAAAQAVINNQNRIENERKQKEYDEKLRLQELEKKRLQEEKRIEEEKNPNSILNKFKNAKVNKENEELKNKLKQMELALAEKEKAESERLEKEKIESERLEQEKVESERLEKEKAQKNKNVKAIKNKK